jgi:hypothetical protein
MKSRATVSWVAKLSTSLREICGTKALIRHRSQGLWNDFLAEFDDRAFSRSQGPICEVGGRLRHIR